MPVPTYIGFVEGGVVRLPAEAVLPDGTKVYVIVPEVVEKVIELETPCKARILSPRLANREQAIDFEPTVTDAEGRRDRSPD